MSPARQDSKRQSGSDGASSEDEGAAVLPLKPTRYIQYFNLHSVFDHHELSLVAVNLNGRSYDQRDGLCPPTSVTCCHAGLLVLMVCSQTMTCCFQFRAGQYFNFRFRDCNKILINYDNHMGSSHGKM